MSTSDSTIKGKFDELAGKTKQAFGDATGDQSTANSGAAQESKRPRGAGLGFGEGSHSRRDGTP